MHNNSSNNCNNDDYYGIEVVGGSSATPPPYNHTNLPPLIALDINKSTSLAMRLKKYNRILTFLSDVGSIIGSAFFSAGSIMGYGFVYGFAPASCGLVTCSLFQSLMALIGAIFFFITPTATFILSNAVSFTDKAMSWNSSMYILGGFLYVLGALAYVPFSFTATDPNKWRIAVILGASLYATASVVYVVAILWDMFRAQKMKNNSQISLLTFIIESWVSTVYLMGSLLILLGSIFSYPELYTPHVYAMFLSGSFCFIVGSTSGFTAQLWHQARLAAIQRKKKLLRQKTKLMESLQWSTSSVRRSTSFRKSHSSPLLAQLHIVEKNNVKPPLLPCTTSLSSNCLKEFTHNDKTDKNETNRLNVFKTRLNNGDFLLVLQIFVQQLALDTIAFFREKYSHIRVLPTLHSGSDTRDDGEGEVKDRDMSTFQECDGHEEVDLPCSVTFSNRHGIDISNVSQQHRNEYIDDL